MKPVSRPCSRVSRPFVVLSALCCAACSRAPQAAAQTDPARAAAAAETITAADLRLRIGALADDSMRGRDTPSPELEKAARHIADAFLSYGLLPAAGDSYLQTYPLTYSAPGPPDGQSVRLEGAGGGALDPSAFVALPGAAEAGAEGPLAATEPGEAPPGGAIALVHLTTTNAQRALGSIRDLLSAGAAGVLLAVDAPAEYFDGLRRFFARERLSVGEPAELGGPAVLVQIEALPAPLRDALARGGPPAGAYRASIRTSARIRRAEAFNTIGWIEGSDPRLRDEYVIFTAHMDHVGVGPPVAGDSIYNGADDDASGTATVMELAEAFASLPTPPRRSLVFMTVSGEEKGLLGSAWYAEHPVFPLESTVANLNIDMIGRNWRDTVVAIGREQSSLGNTLERVVAAHPELGLTMIDDPWPQENFYRRSDHFNFARKGVPILFFFTGTHQDYHRPGDEADRILYEKTSRIARLIFFLGLEIADAPDRPVWDQAAYRSVVEGAR